MLACRFPYPLDCGKTPSLSNCGLSQSARSCVVLAVNTDDGGCRAVRDPDRPLGPQWLKCQRPSSRI
jgi:hypothetical protein